MLGFTLTSPVFKHEEKIPSLYSCDDKDINPPLEISGVPENTASLVLIMDDPDAPMGTWDHWLLWNIPVTEKIEEDCVPTSAMQGLNSWGRSDYGGPCPPPTTGEHRYFFKLYALDTTLDLPEGTEKPAIETAMQGHILGETLLIGLYDKSAN